MAGIPPWRFWSMTRGELALAMRGHSRRLRMEQEGRISLAWHIEALHRQRRLPTLKRLLARKPPRPTPEEWRALARSHADIEAEALGG